MGIVIGGVAAILILSYLSHWYKHRNDIVYVSTHQEADVIHAFGDPGLPPQVVIRDCKNDCPCRHGHPHYHLIDQHQDILRRYPDSFVALHPVNGVAFATPDIIKFTNHMNTVCHTRRNVLVVLHTSVLELSE